MHTRLESKAGGAGRMAGLIDAIGTDGFADSLLEVGRAAAGADYCALYCLEARHLRGVGAASFDGSDIAVRQVGLFVGAEYWRRDPALAEATRRCAPRRPPISVRLFPLALPDREFSTAMWGPTDVTDRLAVWSARGNALYGASFLRRRSHGYFSSDGIADITALAEDLVAALATHDRVTRQTAVPVAGDALDSLPAIGARIAACTTALSAREREVVTRLIAGETGPAIACALGIGAETVATYRKRAYTRLGVACQRELLRWYLDLARPATR